MTIETFSQSKGNGFSQLQQEVDTAAAAHRPPRFHEFFREKTELLHAERYVILKSDLRGVSQWFQIAKTRRK